MVRIHYPLFSSDAAKIRVDSSPSLQSFTEVRTINAPKFRPFFNSETKFRNLFAEISLLSFVLHRTASYSRNVHGVIP